MSRPTKTQRLRPARSALSCDFSQAVAPVLFVLAEKSFGVRCTVAYLPTDGHQHKDGTPIERTMTSVVILSSK